MMRGDDTLTTCAISDAPAGTWASDLTMMTAHHLDAIPSLKSQTIRPCSNQSDRLNESIDGVCE